MISSSSEKGFQTKQEGEANERFFKGPSNSSSRQWSGFRNPRIVRVSRSFGGKDRHSKVCTIRGLRDRRIRLSVPTAIQLYDLQDRLGLGQPSKVIDWLLDVTKHDIDKLPPLPIPQGFGHQFQPQALFSNDQSNASQSTLAPFFDISGGFHPLLSTKELGIKINNSVDGEDPVMMGSKSKYNWDVDSTTSLRAKGKEIERENNIFEKGKWIKTNEQKDDHQDHSNSTNYSGQAAASAQKLFPLPNHPSFPGLLNTTMPFNSSYHWEPSNLSLSQFESHDFLSQAENSLYSNAASLQSSLAVPSGSHLFFCPPATMPTSFFSAYSPYVSSAAESESRQINHFQLLGSTSQHILPNSLTINSQVIPFSLNVNPWLAQTETNAEIHQDKEDT